MVEVVDGGGKVLARSSGLMLHTIVRKMALIYWAFTTQYTSAVNHIEIEFQPVTDIQNSRQDPRIIGFMLVAPPTFRLIGDSCSGFELERRQIFFDPIRQMNLTEPIFFKEQPSCEVTTSKWLSADSVGDYQHQLAVYMPPFVELRSNVYYRIRLPVLNPPVPLDSPLLARVLAQRGASPKLSNSPFLLPALRAWRLFTFVWDGGDAGGGVAPSIGQAASEILGRVAGVRKVDEIAWDGFDII